MRKIVGLLAVFICIGLAAMAQDTTQAKKPKVKAPKKEKVAKPKKQKAAPEPGLVEKPAVKEPKPVIDYKSLNLKQRANDHLMIQLGHDNWAGKAADTMRIKGFGRHLNIYAMYDMPFKTDPHWSVAIGVGVGSSNLFFDKTDIRLVNNTAGQGVVFRNLENENRFKKYKLTNAWAEVPIELRWLANPAQPTKSFKVAVGAKVGTMISAYTKGKDLQNSDGRSIYGKRYTVKEKGRDFFNGPRLVGTLRVGIGSFSLTGAYQITNTFKEGLGPEVRPYSIGLTLSGL